MRSLGVSRDGAKRNTRNRRRTVPLCHHGQRYLHAATLPGCVRAQDDVPPSRLQARLRSLPGSLPGGVRQQARRAGGTAPAYERPAGRAGAQTAVPLVRDGAAPGGRGAQDPRLEGALLPAPPGCALGPVRRRGLLKAFAQISDSQVVQRLASQQIGATVVRKFSACLTALYAVGQAENFLSLARTGHFA